NPYHGTRPGALWHAASPEALRLMIESGADVNAQDAAGWTTLHHIAYYHDDEYYFNPNTMLQILLDSGADINARGRYGVTPLMSAAMNYGSYCWNAETFSFLLKSGADFHALDDRGNGVWYWMTWYWCGDDHKLDKFTYQEILFELYRSVQSEKAKAEGLEETSGSTSLTADKDGRALISNKCGEVGEVVKFLIANGAHPGLMRLERSKENAHRMTDDLQKLRLKPGRLFKGVFSENSAGAIANAVKNNLDLSLEDEDGESFLEAAMRYGASEVVQACVDRGINVNKYGDCTVAYKRVCPLHTAIKAYNADAVEVLLKAGVDLETVNEVPWHEQINIFPEGIDGNEEAKELKRRLDAGAKILRMLHEAGARVPTAGGAELTYVHFGYSDNREFRSLQHYILRKRYQKQKKGVDYEEAVMVLRRAASPKALKLLIDAGTDINARDHTGCTAMHRLADDWGRYFDSCAMLKVLIDAGANVNARDDEGLTPLKLLASYAITHPHALEAIKYLVMAGADIEAKGNTSSVYYWLETSMINTSWKNPLLRNLFDAIVEIFGSKNQKKDEGFARRKADLDLMTVACWGGAVEIESALSRGADVNARSEYGYTPLMFAAAFNTKDAVQFLIGKGADINARGKGKSETALILACMRDWRDHRRSYTTDVVRALIEAGADVNACDDCGNTPLLLVARACDADELAVILIEAGADINAKNKYGNTALKEAMCSFMRYYFHHLKVARALFAAGADPRCFFDDECEDKEQEDEDIGNVDDEESDESDFQVCLRQFGLKV
ncbi:MAG: ankyrin repeat domain-containing protein, partial [Synergistaceae bacterium]|nr:ankyrin repeat domain-containing protein [Synergistaceae bacterium]